MTPHRWFWFCCGVGVLTLPFPAQIRSADPVLYKAQVIRETVARCGPGDGAAMYPTNRLLKGTEVEVVRELPDGWLAIVPPRDSLSWISTQAVQKTTTPYTWVVNLRSDTRADVLAGSRVLDMPPTVVGARVQNGTQLKSYGQTMTSPRGPLLAVASPPSELRYVHAADVQRVSDTGVSASGPPAPVAPTPGGPAGQAPGSPAPVAATGKHPLLVQAEQAEQQGRFQDAALLYEKLFQAVDKTDHDLGVKALNRAQILKETHRYPSSGPVPFPRSTETRYTGAGSAPRPPAPPGPLPPGWIATPPGRLILADHRIDYQQAYLLVNSQGMPIVYATPRPGHSLDSYVNANLELRGIRQWREDLRAFHMVVMEVRRLP
jgi:hypothetical protein